MPFSIPLAVALFLTIWFVVLFAVLPFGIRSQHEAGDFVQGTDPGAPVAPRLLEQDSLDDGDCCHRLRSGERGGGLHGLSEAAG